MPEISTRQKKEKLKTGISEFIGPVLKQLIEAKNDEDSLSKRGQIEEICKLIEETKGVLESREKWDSELIGHFERIERKIDYKREDINWGSVRDDIQELLRKQRENLPKVSTGSEEKTSHLPQEKATSEAGKPSNNSNSNTEVPIQLDEYIKELIPEQRHYFYSLGIFPENAKLKKRLLLYWWIGLEPVSSKENKNSTTEQLAEKFFSDLVKKGILQPIQTRKHNQTINLCTIEPTIHRQIISACESKGLLLDIPDNEEGTLRFYLDERSNARALLNLNQNYLNSEDITRKVLSDNHVLQVVQFGNWNSMDHIEVDDTKFLKKLGENVTFLSLRGISDIEELPQSIMKLGYLRILDLKACHNLEILPQKQWSKSHKILGLLRRQRKWFQNLTHLDVSECFLLDHIPRWVCELSELEVLKGFVASSGGKENQYCRLRDLSNLKKLRKLGIKIAKHLDPEDLNGLKPLENLSVLTIIWNIKENFEGSDAKEHSSCVNNDKLAEVSRSGGEQTRMEEPENQRMVGTHGSFRTSREEETTKENKVQIISFPEKLEKLDIRNYPGDEATELLNPEKLKYLKRLYIRGGKLEKLGNISGWTVEILRLRYLKHLDFNWYHLTSIFTKLKCVEYEQCAKLRHFPKETSCWITETDGPFPCADDEPNKELLIDERVQLTITRNRKAPLASHKQVMMLELAGWDSINDRPGLDLVVVTDVSVMMGGYRNDVQNALVFAKSKLGSSDRLSAVVYSKKATMIHPLSHISEISQKDVETLVGYLDDKGDFVTNLCEGLQMALNIIKDSSNSRGRVAAIMLLSAGISLVTEIPDIGNVAVHTYCLGSSDKYNSELLRDIAYNSVGGTFSDVTSKNLTKAIAVCLAGLATVAVQDLTLTISPIGVESTLEQVSAGRYSQSNDNANGSVTIWFGDLYSSEVRKVLVKLRLPTVDKNRDSGVIQIYCSYKVKEKLFNVEPAIVKVSRTEVSADEHGAQSKTPEPEVIAGVKPEVTAEVKCQEVEMIREVAAPPEVIAEVKRQEIVELIRKIALAPMLDGSDPQTVIDDENNLKTLVNKDPKFDALSEFGVEWGVFRKQIGDVVKCKLFPTRHPVRAGVASYLYSLLVTRDAHDGQHTDGRDDVANYYKKSAPARSFVYSVLVSHDRQRTAVRGDVANFMQFSTPTMREFLKLAPTHEERTFFLGVTNPYFHLRLESG